MHNRTPKPRLLKRKAKKDRPRFTLEARDKTILELLFEYRILNADQIALLVQKRLPSFTRENGQVVDVSPTGTKRRLRILFDTGFVTRPVGQGWLLYQKNRPLIYLLGYRGGQELIQRGHDRSRIKTLLKQNLKPSFFEHALGVSQFHMTLELGLPTRSHELYSWIPESKDLLTSFYHSHDGIRQRYVVNPDGFAIISDKEKKSGYYLFVEMDRGTVAYPRMQKRFEAYYLLYQKGLHAKKPYHIKAKGFRVITMLEQSEPYSVRGRVVDRLEEFKKHIKKSNIIPNSHWRMFWFVRENQYLQDPNKVTEEIFQTPKDGEPRRLL